MTLIEALPGIAFVPLSRDLARRAVKIAIRHRLRGADAIYVTVAEQAASSLVSWDQEVLERGRAVATTVTPVKVLSNLL